MGTFEWSDLLTILILVALEAVLSGDHALVLAVTVLPLPAEQQQKALHYGFIGAYLVVRWVGFKLLWEFLHRSHWVSVEIPQAAGVGGVILLLAGSFFYARAHENWRRWPPPP